MGSLDFDPRLALRLCRLANSCYDNFNIESENAQALVLEEDGFLNVLFAGSREFLDFLEDAMAFPVTPATGGALDALQDVHRGFLIMYSKIRTSVLQRALESKLPVVIGGHSAGFPSSHFLAVELVAAGADVRGVYGWGGPKAMTRGAVARYEALKIPTLNFIHGADMVPDLPPGGLFHRPGRDIYLDEAGNIIPSRDPQAGLDWWHRLVNKVEDHLLIGKSDYVEVFEKLAGERR